MLSLALELERLDRREAISSIGVPTLLIWGTEDTFYPLNTAKEFLAHIPNAELVVIDDVGHFPHMEKSEECNEAILDFMNEASEQLVQLSCV